MTIDRYYTYTYTAAHTRTYTLALARTMQMCEIHLKFSKGAIIEMAFGPQAAYH